MRIQATGSGATCRRILNALPKWFGIPASVDEYVVSADSSPTVIASLGPEDVGLLTIVRHSRYAAEVSVMAVLPELHRHGIGRALLSHAEALLATDGVEFLQVKTLAPSKPDEGYKRRSLLLRLRLPAPRGVPRFVGRRQSCFANDQGRSERRCGGSVRSTMTRAYRAVPRGGRWLAPPGFAAALALSVLFVTVGASPGSASSNALGFVPSFGDAGQRWREGDRTHAGELSDLRRHLVRNKLQSVESRLGEVSVHPLRYRAFLPARQPALEQRALEDFDWRDRAVYDTDRRLPPDQPQTVQRDSRGRVAQREWGDRRRTRLDVVPQRTDPRRFRLGRSLRPTSRRRVGQEDRPCGVLPASRTPATVSPTTFSPRQDRRSARTRRRSSRVCVPTPSSRPASHSRPAAS